MKKVHVFGMLAALAGAILGGRNVAEACSCPLEVDATCLAVSKLSLTYSNNADDTKDKLSVTIKGAEGPVAFGDLGDPSASTSSCLCLYANDVPVPLASVPAGGTCGGNPCWTGKPDKSWTYKDAAATNSGVTKLVHSYKLATALTGATLKAKGTGVADLSLPLTGPLVVQLRESNGYCIGALTADVVQDAGAGKLKAKFDPNAPTCVDGLQNGDEDGIDCGGTFCAACPSCSNGFQDGDETGVDCGGSCAACPTCSDGIQNGSETGVDCGGSCAACPTCRDGIQNGDETGIDCGATGCPLCALGTPKRMFISGLNYAAWQLADQALLDTHCRELADAFDPTNTSDFFAWTCTGPENDPDSRFTKYSDPYVRFSDGFVIASGGWNQLTGGSDLDNSVLKDSGGSIPILTSSVWTGTRTDGTCGVGATPAPANCLNWSTDVGTEQGGIGISNTAFGGLWNAWSSNPCSITLSIYCVEQ